MRFFTESDYLVAIAAMLGNTSLNDPSLLGAMSGIKRRARARAMVEFAQQLDPPPPDRSITTIRALLGQLFGRSISNNALQQHFATPGRKADNRVDALRWDEWLAKHKPRLVDEARKLLSDLNEEWQEFALQAAYRAGQVRKEDTQPTPA